MGLEVTLEEDPDAIFIAQIEETSIRRVVRGANGIDAVALHELEVSAHRLLIEGSPGAWMPFVAVNPTEYDFFSVDGDDISGNGGTPESDPYSDGFGISGDRGVVELGGFGGPRLRVGDRHFGVAGGGELELGDGHGCALRPIDEELGVTVPRGMDEKVVNAAMRPSQQGDLAEDS